MGILLLLFCFQLSGLVISFMLVYIRSRIDSRHLKFKTRKQIFEKRANEQWLIDYFQEHPKKVYRQTFPELYNIALATKKYKHINSLQEEGLITDKQYQSELEKILPLVDVSTELKVIASTT